MDSRAVLGSCPFIKGLCLHSKRSRGTQTTRCMGEGKGRAHKKARHEVGLLTIESRFSMVFIFVFVLMFVFTARAVPVAIVAQIVADRATRSAA